jgi:hypothetical protein
MPTMTDYFALEKNAIRIWRPIDLSNAEHVAAFRQAVEEAARSKPAEIVLDFSQAIALGSVIISMTLQAVEIAKGFGIPLSVRASLQHHQALVTAGIMRFVELRLCG